MLDEASEVGLIAVGVAIVFSGVLLTVCFLWPVCFLHKRFVISDKDEDDVDYVDRPIEDGARDIWEKYPNYWLPAHDISAGDSSQASDLEDSDATTDSGGRFPLSERSRLRRGRHHHYRSTSYTSKLVDQPVTSPTGSTGSLSPTSGSLSPARRPIGRMSAIEAGILWDGSQNLLRIHLTRIVLRSYRRRSKDAPLTLHVLLRRIYRLSDISDTDDTLPGPISTSLPDNELYHIGILGVKEQTLNDEIHIDYIHEPSNYIIVFKLTEKAEYEEQTPPILEGTLNLGDFDNQMENYICIILRQPPSSPGPKGETVLSLCYLPTAEKLSVAVLECKDLRIKDTANQETAMYVKVALVHRGRALKKKKTKIKPVTPHVMFNETFAFDVPQKHVQSVSIVLSFKLLVSAQDSPRVSEKSLGKTVLGAASFSEVAQQHWKCMILNARKPVIQWQSIW